MPIQDHQLLIESFSPHEGHVHGVTGMIATSRSPYQAIEIVELGSYGKALILDGKVQSTTADEFIYHESIIHPAMLCHPHPRRVFVVGGGEGAPVREILKHPSVESVLMVDIDSEVVEFCRRHLPEMSAGAFEDARVRVEFMDARAFLESSDQTFDILIIDISEPIEEGPAYLLFTQEFYKIVFDRSDRTRRAGSPGRDHQPDRFGLFCDRACHPPKRLPGGGPVFRGYPLLRSAVGVPVCGQGGASRRREPGRDRPANSGARSRESPVL